MKIIKKQTVELEEVGPTRAELEHLTTMARNQIELESRLELKFEEVYKIIEELNDLRLKKLPEYAESIGVDSITLSSGDKIEVESKITAKIPEKSNEVVINWLKKNGHGSIIKNEIQLRFDASDDDQVEFEKAMSILRDNEFEITQKSTIDWRTLNKFAKERIESMDDTFDRKLFGVYDVRQSVINGRKPPKFKKS